MIISRKWWLALAAALAAAAIVVIVRSRRRPAPVPSPARQATTGPAVAGTATAEDGTVRPWPAVAEPEPAEGAPVAPWPAVPILGVPTARDLARHTAGPSVLDRPAFTRFAAGGEPRKPLTPAARRHLNRWGAVGLALVLLAAGTQALETAVFSSGPAEHPTGLRAPCDEPVPGVPVTCAVFDVESQQGPAALPTAYGQTQGPPPAEPSPSPLDAACEPPSTEPQVREPSAKTTRAVNRQWRRIETWLRANAPASHRTLGRPATPAAVAAAEAQMGMRFPDDLKASLLRHDGSTGSDDAWAFGPLGNESLSVEEIRRTWRMLCDIDDEDITDGHSTDPRAEWWDGRMIPFGSDGVGDHLVIDSVRRDVGGTDHEGSMSFTPGGIRIRSYHALLKATADALENDGTIGHWKPTAAGGAVVWDVVG
ncbi:SMI1/KNR4 family protein [Nonomuraea sp. NPDC050643]|uniref:SMI1/KNR4 family protein n=1 Tax=Nonomuraea sp. NPDC050643 TaxID=3155660 RepID=UPI0033F0886F